MLTNLSVAKAANGWILRYSIQNPKTGIVTDDCDIYTDISPLLDRIKELLSIVQLEPVQPVEQ